MTKGTRPGDAEMRTRALSRWENEGGALAPTGAPESIDESEMKILARLGAAMLDAWDELSPDLQDRLLRRAKTLGRPGDITHVKEVLARFLRKHSGEG
jgi:hypothetical protein